MKHLLTILLLLSQTTFATNYYISNTGSDSNNGTSTSTAWQTISKVNSSTFVPGDQILFKRGDTFFGSLTISQSGVSGNPITFDAYGTGAKPIITGFTTVTAWTNLGSNIWESTNAVSTLPANNLVYINGYNAPMGRFPNTTDFTFQSHSGSTSITSSNLDGAINWTGAQIAIRKRAWVIEKGVITSQSGSTVNFTDAAAYSLVDGSKFFIQADLRTLDTQNEWYYNPSTKKLSIYSTSQPVNVQVPTIDSLVYSNGKSNVSFLNIDFVGSNSSLIQLTGCTNFVFNNCSFSFAGRDGIQFISGCPGLIVSNSSFQDCNNLGVGSYSTTNTNSNIGSNSLARIGIIPGTAQTYSFGAIMSYGDNSSINNNSLDSTGYSGIDFRGANVNVFNNLVNHACVNRDDGAGIYTGYVNEPGKIIDGNIVLNTLQQGNGIYLDDRGNHITVTNNSVANVGGAGLFLHNANDNTIKNNLIFNSGGNYWTKSNIMLQADAGVNPMRNNRFASNKLITKKSPQLNWFYYNNISQSDLLAYGTSDSNYFVKATTSLNDFDNRSPDAGESTYTLSTWKSVSGQDLNSTTKTVIGDSLILVYATTQNNVSLDGTYKDVITGTSYNGSITLAPYTSAVLSKTADTVATVPPPSANAGADQIIILPVTSTGLSGSSTSASGHTSTFLWTKVSGSGTQSIAGNTTLTPTVSGLLTSGNYVFRFTVTQDDNQTASDDVMITVKDAVIKGQKWLHTKAKIFINKS
jgi:hypothetical protein